MNLSSSSKKPGRKKQNFCFTWPVDKYHNSCQIYSIFFPAVDITIHQFETALLQSERGLCRRNTRNKHLNINHKQDESS